MKANDNIIEVFSPDKIAPIWEITHRRPEIKYDPSRRCCVGTWTGSTEEILDALEQIQKDIPLPIKSIFMKFKTIRNEFFMLMQENREVRND